MIGAIVRRIARGWRKPERRSPADKYPDVPIGRGTYGDLTIEKWDRRFRISIGAYCSFARGVRLLHAVEHRMDWVTTYPFNILHPAGRHITGHPRAKGDITIGNDVWLGTDVIVLSGVTIGDGAVVGARAVVTRDVPPYAVVSGNPAKVVKQRFADDVVARLLQVKWWDWKDEEITRAVPDLLQGDIEAFLGRAESGHYANPP